MKIIVLLSALFLTASCSHHAAPKPEAPPKKALIVLTNNDKLGKTGKKTGWYLSEMTHVYYPLVRAGYTVDFASPNGGFTPIDESSRKLDDPDNKAFLDDAKLVMQTENTIPIAKINPTDYQVIHFPGGHGGMWDLDGSADLQKVTAAIYEQGGVVSAICHGPAALVNVKLSSGKYLVQDKDVNSFTDAEEKEAKKNKIVPFLLETKLKQRGARFQAGKNWEDKVVVSERLVTGQNPQSAHSLGAKVVEVANPTSANPSKN